MSPNVYEVRKADREVEKHCLGAYVAWYLRENVRHLPVAIDGGSTNLRVLERIQDDNRNEVPTVSQVLTNHLEGIYLAQKQRSESTIWRCTGGVLRPTRSTFFEETALIEDFSFSHAVVGVNGFIPPVIQTQTAAEQPMKLAMIKRAQRAVIFPIDSSKWGHPAGAKLRTVNEIILEKQVVLLTCYPHQESRESKRDFDGRLKVFETAVTNLMDSCGYQADIRVRARQVCLPVGLVSESCHLCSDPSSPTFAIRPAESRFFAFLRR